MPPDRAERVADIVEAALDQPAGACEAFVAEACAGDQELRIEVESLLRFRSDAQGFIEQPAFHDDAEWLAELDTRLQPGREIGDYRIIRLLGEGGMGEVYLARDTRLHREVALKFIKTSLSGTSFIRQFRHEERILAALNHPNIARLYGAAVLENGVPYFVMEYVEGERLDEYCDLRRLAIRERLLLFRKICAAVACAHRHLVIHRDLKPANIRVTHDGEPKLLDFGIARVLTDGTDDISPRTVTVSGVMTPDYASPEQVRGDPMTTATDVYSLGVLLYELLTGRKPYAVARHTTDALSRAVVEQEPQRPSTAVVRDDHWPVPAIAIQRTLRGDLDNIILMAIRKEPERRYGTVALLSEDIGRYLEGLPVSARRDTLRYRTAKFAQRHRLGVIAAALVTLTIIGALIATTWQAQRAERQRARAEQRFAQVRRLANSLVFELHGAIENLPGSTAARALLVERALEYLNSLARESSDDASLQRELAAAYVKIGNAQGNPNNANLGDTTGALRSYGEALRIAQDLVTENPEDGAALRQLALALEKRAEVLSSTGNIAAAVESAQESLTAFAAIATRHPDDPKARGSLAISHLKLGDVLGNPNFTNAGDLPGALQNYEAARAILEVLRTAAPDDSLLQRRLGIIHERLGTVHMAKDDLDAAHRAFSRSAEIRQQLAASEANDVDILRDAAIAEEKLGDVFVRRGDLQSALDRRLRSLAIFQRLADADPQNVQARQSLAVSHLHLADLFAPQETPSLDRGADALHHYRAARKLLVDAHGPEPADQRAREMLQAAAARISSLSD